MGWHLVHVVTQLELGGAQLATLYEIAHSDFPDAGRTLMFGPGGLLTAEAEAMPGVRCEVVPALRREVAWASDLRAVVDIWRRLRALRRSAPDVRLLVHSHSSKAGIVARWAAYFAGADVIVHTAHGFGHSHHGGRLARHVFRAVERWTGKVTDGFTADSAANIHQGTSEGLFGEAPTRVVRCGIDVDAYRAASAPVAELRERLGIPADHDVVLNLSCLKPQKDPLTYARVAARVLQQCPRTTFLLAGDGELRSAVEAEAARLGLDQRFRLLGWRRDVPDLLAVSSLLVLTSRWEGLPQAFAQAMAVGLPIVATRVDGAPEAVDHGFSGFLTDTGDVDGLTAHIVALLQDPTLRQRMGERGRDRVHEFSCARMVATLDAFYRALAAAD